MLTTKSSQIPSNRLILVESHHILGKYASAERLVFSGDRAGIWGALKKPGGANLNYN
ncbi:MULTISPECIES: hypothetical protein [unclassified Microcoleus]|uniref:hypothetical protein n=1 Tax=unclassified Microcoleus TaxID=2642155 RepID=UPI002FD6B667